MSTRAAIVVVAVVLALQIYLHLEVHAISTHQRKLDMPIQQTGTYDIRSREGTTFHFVQTQDEDASTFVRRVYTAMNGGSPRAEPKTESWTDKNQNEHTVTLAWDPAWTMQEWCDKFDELVEKFQEAFPCE